MQAQLPVSKTLSEVEAALALARKRHKSGAAKRLVEAKRIRTAMLREEMGRGKVHRKACLARKPCPQPALDLPKPNKLSVEHTAELPGYVPPVDEGEGDLGPVTLFDRRIAA